MPASVMFAAWCLVVAAALARALPRPMDLSVVVNRTVCPIVVHIDEQEDRIPRRIKMLKCASDGHSWCSANRIPAHECCAHTHSRSRHRMECVEIRDQVVVRNVTSGVTSAYPVSVGCTCLVHPPGEPAPHAVPYR